MLSTLISKVLLFVVASFCKAKKKNQEDILRKNASSTEIMQHYIATEYVKTRARPYLSRTLIFPVIKFVFQVMFENISNTLKASIRKHIWCKWILEHNIQFGILLCVMLDLWFSKNS